MGRSETVRVIDLRSPKERGKDKGTHGMKTMLNNQKRQQSRHGRGALGCRLSTIAILILLLVTLVATPSAHAGTYVIANCPAAGNGDAGEWTVFGSPQNAKGTCSEGSNDYIGPKGATMGAGSEAGVQIKAPAQSAITITQAKLWWQVSHQQSGADTFALVADNAGIVNESQTPLTGSEPSTFVLPSTTTELTLTNYCSNDDAGAPCTFGAGENNILELYGAQLTLEDPTLPSGSATGGNLASSGTVSGTASISYQASDTSSGVRLVQLRVDGEPVAGQNYDASCSYSAFQACPPSVSGAVSWDTTTVANGEHRIELVIEDAAQNTSTVYSGEVTVQNATSTTLGANPGPGGPIVTNPSLTSPTPTVTTPNGQNASEQAQLRVGLPGAITRSYAHRALMVAGRLLDSQGQPIAHARLDVLQQTAGTSTPQLLTHTTTGATGTFSTHVPGGPSRLIEIAYRAFSSDAAYTAIVRIKENVQAGVRLNITPTHTGPEGNIELSGTVAGPIPPQGVIVELRVRYRGRWEPFRTPRTKRHGHFSVPYQFQDALGRFPFRAQVPAGQAGFPFAAGESRVIDVHTS